MDLVDRHQKYIDVLLDYEKVFSVTEYMQTFGRHPLPEKFGITNAYKYIISIYPELKDIFRTKKSIVASIKQAVDNQEISATTGKFHVNYNAGYRTPSGEGNMPINYDKIDRESLEKWAGRQVQLHEVNPKIHEMSILHQKVVDLQKKDDVDQIHKLHDNYWQDSKKQGADPEALVIKLIEADIYEAAPENNWLCLPDPGMCLVDTVDSEDGQKFNIYVFESRDGKYDTFFKRPYNQVEYDFWEIKESEDYPYEFPDMLQKIVAFNDKYGQHGFNFFDIQTAISKGEFAGFPEVEMPQPEKVPETENFGPGM